jgi:porin
MEKMNFIRIGIDYYRRYLGAVLICTALGCLFLPSRAVADGDTGQKNGVLTGDWDGRRTSLANKGIDIDVIYKFDAISNTSGGAKTGTRSLDNLDIKFSIDGEKLFGSQGTSALIYFLNNNGSQPGATLANDAEGVDNIEVRNPGAKLYEAWIQQNFMKDRLSILAGLYDLNSEFYVTDSSGLFLRPTFGIGTDMGQSGENGPSIFPVTSVGVRIRVQPYHNFSIQTVALDGVPGDPSNPKGTHIRLGHGDGTLLAGEADYVPGEEAPNGKIGIGAWEYTKKFDDFVDIDSSGNPVKRRSDGIYLIAERRIYDAPGHDEQGLTLFARFGVANGAVNRFDYAWSTGAVYAGLFPGRTKGQLGLGLEGAHTSSKYRRSATSSDASITAFELTYSDYLATWLAIQPDIQYIINPDIDRALPNALIAGARFTAKF